MSPLRPRLPLFLLGLLSGATGLACEVLWNRMLALQFGASTLAVLVTVSVFLLGLGTGSLLGTRAASRVRQPLRILAILEGSIALCALALPAITRALNPLIDVAALHVSLAQWHALLVTAGACLLALPAVAMGICFPLLVRAWNGTGRSVALAYGSNTVGASLGALLALNLLESLGWSQAMRAVALLGALTAFGYSLLGPAGAVGSQPYDTAVSAPPLVNRRVLWAYGAIGAASLVLELAWTRLFGLAMLRTEYTLAWVLAVLLLGVGAGSLLATRRAVRQALTWFPWLAALTVLAGLRMLPTVSAWVEGARFDSWFQAQWMQGLVLAAILLPATLVLGAWMPSLAERFGLGGGTLYGVNCLGAVLGAAIYVVLVPHSGSTGAVAVAAIMLLAAGLVAHGNEGVAWAASLPLIALAVYLAPMPPTRLWLPLSLGGSHDLYRYEDALVSTQVVELADGQRLLLTDLRRADASTDPTAVFVQANQVRLPLVLCPHARSVLFLGLGTGISAAGSLAAGPMQRTAVELSAGSIAAAAQWFAPINRGVSASMTIVRDDARHYLSAGEGSYDVIVGDLFHPDLAGAGSLLSVEQFQRARARLAPQGVFVQWLALNQFDVITLHTVMRSFHAVFPHGRLFLDGLHLALVGARDWADIGWQQEYAKAGVPPGGYSELGNGGEHPRVWLARYMGEVGIDGTEVQHEWAPRIEFGLPKLRYRQENPMVPVLKDLLQRRPSSEAAARMFNVAASAYPGFRRMYLANELRVQAELARWSGNDARADHLMALALQGNAEDRWIQYAVSDRLLSALQAAPAASIDRSAVLRSILNVNPWSAEAWRAWWLQQKQNDSSASETSHLQLLQLDPLGLSSAPPMLR